MKTIIPLAAIELFVWLALLLSAFSISRLVYTINFGTQTVVARAATETVRVIVSGAIVVAWLFAWKLLVDTYFWHTIRGKETAN